MKKILLLIFLLSTVLTEKSFAYVYDCQIFNQILDHKAVVGELVISAEHDKNDKVLASLDSEKREFLSDDIIISKTYEGTIGQMIVSHHSGGFVPKGSYDIFVSRNNNPKSDSYFTAIFRDGFGVINTITISPWDMKIYVFISDNPKQIFKGTCK